MWILPAASHMITAGEFIECAGVRTVRPEGSTPAAVKTDDRRGK